MHADRAKHFLLTRREERSSPYRSPNSERQKRTRVISVSPCDVFYLGDKCIRMSHHARKVAIGKRTELFREMIIDVNRQFRWTRLNKSDSEEEKRSWLNAYIYMIDDFSLFCYVR